MNKDEIISIRGDESEWYKQAVFVMREEVVKNYTQKDLKQEADRIIGNYVKQNGIFPEKVSPKTDIRLNLIIWGGVCVLLIDLWLL